MVSYKKVYKKLRVVINYENCGKRMIKVKNKNKLNLGLKAKILK